MEKWKQNVYHFQIEVESLQWFEKLSRLVPFSQNTLKNTVRQQNTTVKQWKPNRVCRFLLVCVLKVSRNNKTPISLNHVTYIIPLLDIYYQDLPIHWLTGKNYDLNVTLSLATWLTGAQVRKQTDWLNRPSASRLTSQKSVNSQHIETPSPRYHTIETVSVPRTREYRKRPNQFMSNHLIDVQQIKMFTIHRTIDKTWLTEYQVPFYKSTFCKWFD